MESQLTWLAVVALVAHLAPHSTAGPNECTYYYSSRESSAQRNSRKYYYSCGFFGWSRCTGYSYYYSAHYYYVTRSRRDCCQGWRRDGSSQCTVPICSPSCQHGGTCYYPNTCSCRSDNEYYGERSYCSTRCPSISKCVVEQCTSPQDVTCQKCQSNIDLTSIAYEKSPYGKQCVFRCSWKDNWCWPGYCSGSSYVADSCTCAPGFTGSPKCLKIQSYSDVLVLDVSLVNSAHNHFANYTYSSNATVYSNIVPDKVVISMKAQFNGPQLGTDTFSTTRWETDYRNYSAPPWIVDYRLGISRAEVSFSTRLQGIRHLLSQSNNLQCKHLGTKVSLSNSAVSSPVDCALTFNLSGRTFNHNDGLDADIEIENGGHIDIRNMDIPFRTKTTHYYSGSIKLVTVSFVFDRASPVHCSLDSSINCPSGITPSSMLSVGATVKEHSNVTVSWDGWFDTAGGSGISKYSLEIYEMEHQGYKLSEKAAPFDRKNFDSLARSYNLTLTQSGLFSIVLYVHDVAGNFRLARRLVLYDESSVVAIESKHPLSFPFAVNSGHTFWQTVVQGQVLTTWTGHFYNTLIKKDPLLRQIASFRQSIDNNYDQPNSGSLGLGGTVNNAGIVRYKYAITYGLNPRKSHDSAFLDVPQRMSGLDLWQNYTIPTKTSDGDHITVWIKAIDVWGRDAVDSATVHVDFSSPDISNVGLIRDGEADLTFLSSLEFHTINVAFSVDDPHSGVVMAFWRLGETQGGSEMGQGRILTRAASQSECHPFNCSCTSLLICSYFTYQLDLHPGQFSRGSGQHARTYYLTINATNDAQLSSSKQLAIAVDNSPPSVGHVIDGPTGQTDVDSQHSYTIQAHWIGFRDPDSGIHHYRYSVASYCLSKEDFTLGKNTVYKTSAESTAPVTVNSAGMYYVSVVAYNNALEPSDVVCSDGITVDITPPLLEQISVRHLQSTSGLIAQKNNNTVWLIDNNRRRQPLTWFSAECRPHALIVSDITVYPLDVANISSPQRVTKCPYPPSSPYFYTHANRFLSVSWKGSDGDSGIHDYEVGLGRTESEDPPTVLPFQSTKGNPQYSRPITTLTVGLEYFLIIRATNKAGITIKKTVGPIIVDVTAPQLRGKVNFKYDVQTMAVLVSWTSATFVDPEDTSLQYIIGAGSVPDRDDVVPFTTIDRFNSCRVDDICVSLPGLLLDTKARGNTAIFFLVQARNRAGLFAVATSDAYMHVALPPTAGTVFDQLPSEDGDVVGQMFSAKQDDVDYQTSRSALRCRWTGFNDPVSAVSLQIGVGTKPYGDDTVPFRAIDSSLHSYEIRNLTLLPLKTYFFTINASNSIGYVSVSSNGVKTVSGAIEGTVHDGPGCFRPSSFHNLSSVTMWSQMPNACSLELQGAMALSPGCRLSANVATTPGQWYTAMISTNWGQHPTFTSTALSVTTAGISTSLAPNQAIAINRDSWESIPIHFRAVSLRTLITLEASGTNSVSVRNVRVLECKEDIDFQSHDSAVSAHWSIGKQFLPFVTHYKWALFRNASDGLSEVTPYTDVGNVSHASNTQLSLPETGHYRIGVRPCNPSLCFRAIFSDGFHIMPRSPVASPVTATITSRTKGRNSNDALAVNNSTAVDISLGWYPFVTFLSSGKKIVAEVYTWTITVPGSSALLIPWRSLTSTGRVMVNDTVLLNISRRKTLLVVVRSYNQVGRYSDAAAQVVMPFAHPLHGLLPTVYDVMASKTKETLDPLTGQVVKPSVSDTNEIDFIDSTHTLAASWPWLKHGRSEWIVVRDSPIWRSCNSSVDVLACGVTRETYHVVDDLSLEHGITYYFCITVIEIIGAHGIEATLTGSVICSDGVTVDKTAPVEGEVFLGLGSHGSSYQTFTDTLIVRWRGFADVEEMADVQSGIKEYSVALGTAPDQRDTADYVTVGSATHWIFTGLALENGKTYYATVRAVDHVLHGVSVSSNALTVDTTPPIQGQIDIEASETGYITGNLKGDWTEFEDQESGIARYQWCIGSGAGYDDAVTCRSTTATNFESSVSKLLYPGHTYFVTVKAFNNAGLETVQTTNAFVFDDSPPAAGFVLDSEPGNDSDRDYQQQLDVLTCQWKDFGDPHSAVRHYSVAFGSEQGSGDVVAFHDVGKLTNYTIQHVALEPGRPYYCTVVACNQADLCTTVSSDGVIPDNSPPVIGLVHDGLGDGDTQYQSQSDVVGSKWFGFHDAHSSIARYEWCVGTAPGTDDLVSWTDTFVEQMAVKTGLNSLPSMRRIYTSVRAYNKAGLSSVSSSDGFVVDHTPPVVRTAPFFNTTARSLKPDSQYSTSVIQASWKFDDGESPIIRHTVVIPTRDRVTPAAEPVVLESERQISISRPNITLNDGERYYVSVTACNAAGLCVHETSRQSLLVDGSPPLTGSISDHIRWRTNGSATVVDLRWRGFTDPHSGVSQYIISVGTTYSGNQYTPSYVLVNHSGGSESEQNTPIAMQNRLMAGDRLYVSLWAINGVNLRSRQVQKSMICGITDSTSGVLTIEKHSCEVTSCLGHCTCAALNSLCDRRLYGTNCTKVPTSGVPVNSRLTVSDFLTVSNLYSTASTSSLQGSWALNSASPAWIPLRYEVTAGTANAPGDGIYDVKRDRVWHEVGLMTTAVITLPPSRNLIARTTYIIYVRVWYSGSKYAVFQSRGVTPDVSPPKLSSRQRVMDRTPLATGDVDFVTTHTDKLSVSWQGSFSDPQSGIDHFAYAFGTTPGGDDVVSLTSTQSDVYKANVTGLTLAPGIHYYATVQAYNLLGLHQATTTDGVVIDTEIPLAGVVLDGDQQHDLQYQSNNTTLSAKWHGFFDRHSFIESYHIGIGDSPGTWIVHRLINVGLKLFASVRGLTLLSGVRYHATVVAVDAAGLKSSIVSSNGVLVDSSPPVFSSCKQFGQNLLQNTNDVKENITSIAVKFPSNWTVDNGKMTVNTSEEGKQYLVLSGTISHVVSFTKDVLYYLSIEARSVGFSHTQHMEVRAPGLHKVIALRPRGSPAKSYSFQIVPDKTEEGFISITSASSVGDVIAIDSYALRKCLRYLPDSASSQSSTSSITERRRYLGQYDTVEAVWKADDPQSSIKEFLWAIGTVKGGQQLQTFRSVGLANHATNRHAGLRHGMQVFLTVVAINNAGLATTLQPSTLFVDFTPPEIADIAVESLTSRFDTNVLYITNSTITASWNGTADPESGIHYCQWGIGLSPMSTELLPFQSIDQAAFKGSADIGSLRSGQTCYVTVRCYNNVGLSATRTSPGTSYIAKPPDGISALVTLDINVDSPYGHREVYQTSNSSVSFHWAGFHDQAGISHYQVKVEGDSLRATDWFNVGHYTRAKVSGLDMRDGHQYTVAVRAVNYGGLQSNKASANFTVIQTPPAVTGISIVGTWTISGQLKLSWLNVFKPENLLVYELTVGTHPGSGDVLQWFETAITEHTLVASKVSRFKDYHIAVTAINAAGLHTTIVTTVHAQP